MEIIEKESGKTLRATIPHPTGPECQAFELDAGEDTVLLELRRGPGGDDLTGDCLIRLSKLDALLVAQELINFVSEMEN